MSQESPGISKSRSFCLTGAGVMLALATAGAVTALCLELGFYEVPFSREGLRVFQWAAIAAFLLERLCNVALLPQRGEYLRENWFDFVLMAAGIGAALASAAGKISAPVLPVAVLYVIITQVYTLVAAALKKVDPGGPAGQGGLHPVAALMGGYLTLIAAGAMLLLLPKAAADAMKPLTPLDALFTSTSAACLCGLSVCDISARLTIFGQIVVMTLMQLGAMGVMTFGVIVACQARRALQPGEGLDDISARQATERMIRLGVLFIFIVEIAGSVASVNMWRQAELEQGWAVAAYRSVFHTVSAFTNGGFDLQGAGLQRVAGHWQTLGILAPLMVLGGLGIPVLSDLGVWFRSRLVRKGTPPAALPLYSKLVLTTTVLLIVLGAGGLMWIENASFPGYTFGAHYSEQDNAGVSCQGLGLVDLPPQEQVSHALYQSISARSCGLPTLDIDKFSEGGKLWTCLLMLIGGSPGGAAGGIKTTTLAVLVLTVWSVLRRRQEVDTFGHTIPQGVVRLALTLTAVYLAAIVVLAIMLSVNMAGRRLLSTSLPPTFMQLFFETTSAVGEVGFSCNVTPSLTASGRGTIILAMVLGRLGLPVLAWTLAGRLRAVRHNPPAEPLLLG